MQGRASVLLRGDARLRALALSFDDGPSEWTAAILDVLRDHAVRATFFAIGEAIAGREGLLGRIVAEGHEVGNHTWSHPRLTEPGVDVAGEIERGSAAIASVLGTRPRLFRPPHLALDATVVEAALESGLPEIVLASVAPDDWDADAPEPIVSAVLREAAPGAIVCLHDGRPPRASRSRESRRPTAEAVAQLVPALQADGYALVKVSEL